MADFCLDCLNELNETDLQTEDVKISRDYTLCEGCGEMKQVVLRIK